ncbi:hypothetical protein QYE76_000674 [Lolium multiflorum]|uniref:Uncharacterized protein n=1 Tax=Lolium multiflorum TaxID=4521 RepID=A0AAD8VXW0_LOLMU|nr:hypothetical protein QYE76_000674 [Lolium multiflorum]
MTALTATATKDTTHQFGLHQQLRSHRYTEREDAPGRVAYQRRGRTRKENHGSATAAGHTTATPVSSSSRRRFLLVTSWEEVLAIDASDELESPSDEWSLGSSSSSVNGSCVCALARALASFFAAASSAASSASSRVHLVGVALPRRFGAPF